MLRGTTESKNMFLKLRCRAKTELFMTYSKHVIACQLTNMHIPTENFASCAFFENSQKLL